MKRCIENCLQITCEDVDLKTVSNIEFYLKQGRFFRQYEPEVVSEHEMLVHIPLKDAKQLTQADVKLQFAYTDVNGIPRATEPETVTVGEFLKEAGYDPV